MSKVSNPVQAGIFFRLSFRNCKSCVYNCDDLPSYSKNIVKLLAISQTIHTVCCEDDYFQRKNLNYLIVCFTQSTLFFQKVCFLFQICLLCVFCGTYVTKINAVLWQTTRETFASLGLFTFARIACLLQL